MPATSQQPAIQQSGRLPSLVWKIHSISSTLACRPVSAAANPSRGSSIAYSVEIELIVDRRIVSVTEDLRVARSRDELQRTSGKAERGEAAAYPSMTVVLLSAMSMRWRWS